MRKGSKIKGLRVVSNGDGADLGTVRRLLFDETGDNLEALVVSDKDLFGLIDARAVPWTEVRTMGNDAVIVQQSDSLINIHEDGRLAGLYDGAEPASGVRVYTTDGRDLGTLSDVFVDEASGHVVGYELSGGVLADMTGGRRFINVPESLRYGQNLALVPPSVADNTEAQAQAEPGGLKGAYASAKDSVTDTYANVAGASVEKQKEFVVGKVASTDVIIPAESATMATPAALPPSPISGYEISETALVDPVTATGAVSSMMAQDVTSTGAVTSGEVLVRQGETITHEHADRAESAGVLGPLVIAAGGGALSGVTGAASEHLDAASTSVSTTGANLQSSAEAAAIGKMAGRYVEAADGSTIVAPGQTITQTVMECARMEGKEREVIVAASVGVAKQGLATAQESAGNFFEAAKEKIAEWTGAAQEKKSQYDAQREEAQIQDAIGRPVTRVILAPNDEVILNTGDLVTNKAIEHARREEVLELILDSISTIEPDITPEMLRARDAGTDALATQVQPTGGPITATVAPDNA